MQNKVFPTIAKRLVIIAIIVVAICFSPLLIPMFLDLSYPEPPKPEVVYGEFPFEIVLEVDGETKVFDNIYICEYDGFDSNEGVGKFRDWKGYIKGTDSDTLFIKKEGNKSIYCSVGSPAYYMGDYDDKSYLPFPFVFSEEKNSAGGISMHRFNDNDMNEYNIKIISYKFSDAIVNTFN